MKLRRAVVATAATAVIAPLALLSAPVAFASEAPTTPANSQTAGEKSEEPTETATPEGDQKSEEPTETATPPADDEEKGEEPTETTTPPAGDDEESPAPSASPSSSASPKPSPTTGGDDFDPYTDCQSVKLDDNLSASISGLPNKIVAGSGWHNFKFVVTNNSDKDLKNVWVNAFTEYNDDVNLDDSLALNLATIQVKQDGKWNDSYHEAFGDTTLTGTFTALFGNLDAHTTAELDLRVSVKASAPAGSSFAISQAVYAGKGKTCYMNGDYYDFEIVAAGSKAPGGVGDSKPNGKKPSGVVNQDVKPQGGVKEVTGSLAETGSSSALPTIALVGGIAVVAGGGAVFAMRRRKSAGQLA
ncbi:LAETG motif-containing sortase-dependent surface protein [Streptomyces sp. SID2888]|uniref:LAETG motif-containing sortase-dependent surface protein n=1 Tax=Streptomyces sp. SID2888 TaxID=2690256 RepID=UPI00136922D6|nr:LAETG motif-containing sortase-dependent surface protein [Streptomyces sp. SID2888]MYV49308.1 LPXTG cell wall anchor domain-containing protein [Streptomyces sp. SID2888]